MRLFEAWWQRDKGRFQKLFDEWLMDDGSPMERRLALEMAQLDPLPAGTFDIFDKMFLEEGKVREVTLLVNTDAGIFAACSETNLAGDIGGDCSGMPKQHLFLITMLGLNPRAIQHLSTISTAQPNKFSIWSGD